MDYLMLGPTPYGETCEPVNGDPNRIMLECRLYKEQLERLYPTAKFGIKSFSHDFGTYKEVVVYFRPADETSVALAFEIEGNCPENWDEISLNKLKE